MYTLAMDTSGGGFSVAVLINNHTKYKYCSFKNTRGSQGLLPAIDRLLKKGKITLEAIDCFALSKGPGSFTGLRIGYALVKGFCIGRDKQVVQVSSLDVSAYNSSFGCVGKMCVLEDAKQSKLYTCLYSVNNGRIKRLSKYKIQTVDEIINSLSGKIYFAGGGVNLCKDVITNCRSIEPLFIYKKKYKCTAEVVGILGYDEFSKGKVLSADDINPMYLYPKECAIRGYKL